MRIISNKALVDFAHEHRSAGKPLQAWRKLIEGHHVANFAQLKRLMNATDRVDDFYVFDIAGNRYRIVAAIHVNRQMLFVRHVFTHLAFQRWNLRR